MQIDVKAKNEEGEILFEGKLNKFEVGFLIQYAVNGLMSSGAIFELQRPTERDDEVRIKFSEKDKQH
jgi:hypothetical protein